MTVSACLIVRNEAHHLFACLASLYQQVDEIILLDTGSTDGTTNLDWLYDRIPELQQDGPIAWPPTILSHMEWSDSFAEAKNEAIGMAQGDWLLNIDADERLEGDLRGLCDNTPADDMAYVVEVRSIFSHEMESVSPQIRLFRNHQGFAFRGRIHEQIQTADGQDLPRSPSPLVFRHVGYDQRGITVLGGKQVTGPERLEGKKDRNKRLLDLGLQEEPGNPRYWYERMREQLRAEDNEQAFITGAYCLALWGETGEQRDYVSPLLEYLLDCGRRTGMREQAQQVWGLVPEQYRTPRAWQLYGLVIAGTLG